MSCAAHSKGIYVPGIKQFIWEKDRLQDRCRKKTSDSFRMRWKKKRNPQCIIRLQIYSIIRMQGTFTHKKYLSAFTEKILILKTFSFLLSKQNISKRSALFCAVVLFLFSFCCLHSKVCFFPIEIYVVEPTEESKYEFFCFCFMSLLCMSLL
jgi:hypothetical protein